MNWKMVIKILSIVLIITGVAMIPSMFASAYYGENEAMVGFGTSSALTIIVALIMFFRNRDASNKLRLREGYLIVALCWIMCSVVGAVPYLLANHSTTIIDAFFESCSGFTTTGSTVMDIETMSKGIMLWKAVTHWLGGMGILVFAVSILPALGIGGYNLFSAEAPGIRVDKMSNRMSDTTRILYLMYIIMFVVEFVLLSFSSMSSFDALINTLGSMTTSGIFSHSAGIAYFDSLYVEVIITVFTILASINFTLYHHAFNKNFKAFFGDIELRVFLCLILGAAAFMTVNLYASGTYDSLTEAAGQSLFHSASFATTTGYSLTDYNLWPGASKFALIILMFIGGCGSSTSGSIKVVRIIVAVKLMFRNLYQQIHPRAVVAVKVGGKAIPAQIVSQATTFILTFVLTFFAGSLVLSLQGLDMQTTLSATIAMLSNTGIAFGDIGASGNFGMFCQPLRLVLCFLMLLGRLELFTVIYLFVPTFWNPDKHTM